MPGSRFLKSPLLGRSHFLFPTQGYLIPTKGEETQKTKWKELGWSPVVWCKGQYYTITLISLSYSGYSVALKEVLVYSALRHCHTEEPFLRNKKKTSILVIPKGHLEPGLVPKDEDVLLAGSYSLLRFTAQQLKHQAEWLVQYISTSLTHRFSVNYSSLLSTLMPKYSTC